MCVLPAGFDQVSATPLKGFRLVTSPTVTFDQVKSVCASVDRSARGANIRTVEEFNYLQGLGELIGLTMVDILFYHGAT